MPLGLKNECILRLRDSLSEQLASVRVNNGMFISSASTASLLLAERVLPVTGKLHDSLLKHVGESPLIDFVSGTLAREIYESQEFKTGDDKLLRDLPEYSDLESLANRLVQEFDSLPWQYTVTCELPTHFSEVFCGLEKDFELSNEVRISCGTELFSSTYPIASNIEKRNEAIAGSSLLTFGIGPRPSWKHDRAYLQVKTLGFIGKFIQTEPLADATSQIKAFLGLAIALRLFKLTYVYQPYPQVEKLYIHRNVASQWIIEDVHELDPRYAEVVRKLRFHDLDGALGDDAAKLRWLDRQLRSIGAVFKARDRMRNVLLGAQWLFESYSGTDELLQFVQAAVVVEILLGDKSSSDLTGLGELLSNRCAYLIATSHSERQELISDFRRIYDVRSKIVHRGKSRLLLEERSLFDKLRWICRRVIQEEVMLLAKDDAGGA